MRGWSISIFLVAGIFSTLVAAGEPLVNLGRLSIARVYGSKADIDRPLDNPFYGLPNLFDEGAHRFNNVAYTYWSTHEAPQWVRTGFAEPVTIHRIEIETASKTLSEHRFSSVTISTEPGGDQATIEAANQREETITWQPAAPIRDVRVVRLEFEGPDYIQVEEIRILGVPPSGVDSRQSMPKLDVAYARRLQEEAKLEKRRRREAIYANIEAQLQAIRGTYATLSGESSGTELANKWLNMNRAADRLALGLWKLREFVPQHRAWYKHSKSFAEQTRSYGGWIRFCEISTSWGASRKGYRKYLELWPDGPDADEATWLLIGNGPRCGEFEPTIGAWEYNIRHYGAFVERFPVSIFAEEARKRHEAAHVGLRKAKEREARRQ